MTTTETKAPAANANPNPPAKSEPPRPTRFETTPDQRPHTHRGPISRFFRSLFTHLLFAGAAVAGVLGYLYHAPILRDVGDTVCAEKVLGQWMSNGSGTKSAAQSKPVAATTAEATAPAAASSPPKTEVATPAAATSTAPASQSQPTPATKQDTTATPAAPSPATSGAAEPTAVVAKPAEPVATPATPSSASPPPSAPAETPSAARASAPPSAAPASAPSAAAAAAANEPTAPPAETAALNSPAAPVEAPGTVTKPAAAEKPAPAAKSPAADPLLDAWADARKAFADGKPEAVAAYQDLARRFPDVPELTGELGNIYFQQGKMKEAANLYYETAQRLIRKGEPGPAACLIDVMRFLDADKAKALEQQTSVPCPATSVTR